MQKELKEIENQVCSYEEAKILKECRAPQDFYDGVLFWDDTYDPPRLRVWLEGMDREKACPRAFTPLELRDLFRSR